MSDIPDYMRGFDLDQDFGFTPVNQKPVEISKVKSDVQTIKSMMNEIMQIVAEKDTITTEISNEETVKRFKEVEKVILPFLYNLAKSEEDYIYWPNRGPIIKAQIEKILKLTRG